MSGHALITELKYANDMIRMVGRRSESRNKEAAEEDSQPGGPLDGGTPDVRKRRALTSSD